jgi:ABC-type polysaccharide/polyol phosphate transport system ATPase subunit
VSLDAVAKRYTIYSRRGSGLKEKVLATLGGRAERPEELWALRGVSLAIEPGETIGLIGPNGGGKSTLLQLVAGILEPDRGTVVVRGRVTSLLELGAGFSPDLSGRENVFLNAALHGVPEATTRARFDSIVAFSGLERFIDTPVRNYSSGMYMRLGFAVAVHLDPEVLLVDEAFAVGDETFQRQCLLKVHEFQRQGVTIVVVSHDLLLVERLATRACLLAGGALVASGRPGEVVAEYHQRAAGADGNGAERRWGTGEATIVGLDLLEGDRPVAVARTHMPLTLRLRYRAAVPVAHPVFGLAIHRDDGVLVSGPNTRMSGMTIDEIRGDGVLEYRVERLPLLPGRYLVSASIYDEPLVTAFDHRDRFKPLVVVEGGTDQRFGVVDLDGRWAT